MSWGKPVVYPSARRDRIGLVPDVVRAQYPSILLKSERYLPRHPHQVLVYIAVTDVQPECSVFFQDSLELTEDHHELGDIDFYSCLLAQLCALAIVSQPPVGRAGNAASSVVVSAIGLQNTERVPVCNPGCRSSCFWIHYDTARIADASNKTSMVRANAANAISARS